MAGTVLPSSETLLTPAEDVPTVATKKVPLRRGNVRSPHRIAGKLSCTSISWREGMGSFNVFRRPEVYQSC